MCYPKPGPRCSTIGREFYERAQKAYAEDETEENFLKVQEARDAYLITTEGLERLKVASEEATTPRTKKKLTDVYERYRSEREDRVRVANLNIERDKREYASIKQSWVDEGLSHDEVTDDMVKARLKAQRVVASVEGLVRLDPPGSQSEQYKRDENGQVAEVYYASYGSNLFADRFNVYIAGGEVNGTTSYEGCRDKTLPQDDIKLALPGSIHYAGESYVWTGAPAFLDTSVKNTASLGRAYRISTQQFEDVVAQESMTPVGEYQFDSEHLLKEGHITTPGLYGKLEHVGDHNGAPVLTFTSPFTSAQARSGEYTVTEDGYMKHIGKTEVNKLRTSREGVSQEIAQGTKSRDSKDVMREYPIYTHPPSPAYLNTIANGIQEAHGLDETTAREYFNGSSGAYGTLN